MAAQVSPADLALVWANGSADLSIVAIDTPALDFDLASDRGLATAVLLSLFTDRRAQDDDKPPSGDATDRRGWWADQFATVEGDRIGSRLWLLDRSTLTNETVLRAKQYTAEALAWMLEDRAVSAVDVDVQIVGRQVELIGVTLHRPGRDPLSIRFDHVWDAIS